MKTSFAIIAALVTGALAQPALCDEWNFGVYLDGKRIGEHRFAIERDTQTGAARVTSDAHFDVKVLMVPVFKYRHTADELWQNGCLISLETRTRVNGKDYAVSGRRGDGAFNIDVSSEGQTRADHLPDCVATYAYWDADVLRRHGALLNGQTGEYERVGLDESADGSAWQIELAGDDFRFDLSYRDRDGSWDGLRTTTRDGRTLDYRRETTRAAWL